MTTLSLPNTTTHRSRARPSTPSPPPRSAAATSTCWSPAPTPAPPPRPRRRSPASPRCCIADGAAASPTAWPRTSPRRCWRIAGELHATSCSRPPPTARTSRRASPPSSTSAQITDITKVDRARHLRAPDLRRQRDRHRAERPTRSRSSPCAPPASIPPRRPAARAAVENVDARSPTAASRSFVGREIAKIDRPELTAAKIIVSGGRALGSRREVQEVLEPLADKLGAAHRRLARRGRCRLRAERLAGRPDRQDRRAAAVHRRRHLGRDPAPGRHEGLAR